MLTSVAPEAVPKGQAAAPLGAWYPVCRTGQSRRRRTVSLHGQTLTLDMGGATPRLVDPAPQSARLMTAHGMVWACLAPADTPGIPPLPDDEAGDMRLIAYSLIRVKADYDQAVLGLVDPAHVPMVHNSWWWRADPVRKVKTKQYTPSPWGFTAVSCDDFASAPAYDLVGKERSVSIEFRLPSLRIERVTAPKFRLFNLTTVTPESEGQVALRNLIFCNVRALTAARPPLSWLGRRFLGQDAAILNRLEGQQLGPRPLFAGPPDQPSLWYYACKRALLRAQQSDAAFENPVEPSILKWRT